MADVPYPITGDTIEELAKQTFDIFRDLYYDRIGGAMVGDVFTNESDVLELNVAEGSGLFKNDDGELDFAVTADTISNAPAGNISATTVQGAINELSADKVDTDGNLQCDYFTFDETSEVPDPPAGYKVLHIDVSNLTEPWLLAVGPLFDYFVMEA